MILINLFSVFDPTSYLSIPLNWVIVLVIYLYFFRGNYVIKGGYNKFKIGVLKIIHLIFKDIAADKYLGIVFLRVLRFIFLIRSNLIGLLPYVFRFTAHIYVTLGLGLVLWIRFFFIGWFKNFKNRVAHLVPEGRPLILSPLMVIIERIRHLIRPFTLSVRLAANIISGHLIIGLLSGIRIIGGIGIIVSLVFQRVLLVLEFGVALIQGFVFRLLLLLYSLEYY